MRRLLLALLITVIASPALAQPDCGYGLPCGGIPWRLPNWPRLSSPTPMPTSSSNGPTATPGPSPTPGIGATPTQTREPIDTSTLDQQIATVSALMNATPNVINDINGTPVDSDAQFVELGNNAGQLFSYMRGVSSITDTVFGKMSPLVIFAFLSFAIIFSIRVWTFLLPLLSAFFSAIARIIQLILDFLPL